MCVAAAAMYVFAIFYSAGVGAVAYTVSFRLCRAVRESFDIWIIVPC